MVIDTETFTGSLGDVRALCEVVDFGSISAAARRLGENKGAVSRRISRLEAKLGIRLLARTSRAVTPTEEGRAFHLKAQAGLALLDEAADSARGQRDIPRGHLRITAAVDVSIDILPPLIVAFREAHPRISVEIIATDTLIDLAAHRIDLAVRIGLGGLPDQSYHGHLLMSGSLSFYAAPSWLARRGTPVSPDDLQSPDLIVAEKGGPGRAIIFKSAAGQSYEIRGRVGVNVSDLATALRVAEAGGGVAILPDVIAMQSRQAGRVVPVLADWTLPGLKVHALTLAGRDMPVRVRLFRSFLHEWLAAMRSDDMP